MIYEPRLEPTKFNLYLVSRNSSKNSLNTSDVNENLLVSNHLLPYEALMQFCYPKKTMKNYYYHEIKQYIVLLSKYHHEIYFGIILEFFCFSFKSGF